MERTYLGKPGKIFGPFTEEEIAELKMSGEFRAYSWLWDPESESWIAINLPPIPPMYRSGIEISKEQESDQIEIESFSRVDPGAPVNATLSGLALNPDLTNRVVMTNATKDSQPGSSVESPVVTPEFPTMTAASAVVESIGVPQIPAVLDDGAKGTQPKPAATAAPAASPATTPAAAPTKPAQSAPKIPVTPPAAKPAAPAPVAEANPGSPISARKVQLPPKGAIPPKPASSPSFADNRAPVSAVCHDEKTLLSGSVSNFTPGEVTFLAEQESHELPPFHKGARLWLNLYDDTSGKSEAVRVVLADFRRRGGRWEFKMTWERIPNVLSR